MVAILTVAATYIDGLFNFKTGSLLDGYAGAVIRVLAWAAYALCTGTIGFGIWVIGHECEQQQQQPFNFAKVSEDVHRIVKLTK